MSATNLAAFIIGCLFAGVLAALATVVVWKLRPNEHHMGPGILALCLGIFACVVFGTSMSIAVRDPNAPASSQVNGCQPGTYDNGSRGDGPKCFPFPVGSGR